MLRAAVAAKSDVGIKAQEYMTSGALVPDEVVCGVVAERLEQEDCKSSGVLLDGFPRTEVQAKVLKDLAGDVDLVIFLEVDESALVERVCGRRIDPETGNSYHIKFNWPEDMPEDVKARLVQRDDDTEDKVKVRLQGYNKNVDAIRGFYEAQGVTVDGNRKPEEVRKDIAVAIEKKLAEMSTV